MTEVIGIDHIYIAVSDLGRSEAFYDRAMPALGFRKNTFTIGGDPHVQYFNRHFGFVLRPARTRIPHDPYAPGLHHFCLRVEGKEDVEERGGEVARSRYRRFRPEAVPGIRGRLLCKLLQRPGWLAAGSDQLPRRAPQTA